MAVTTVSEFGVTLYHTHVVAMGKFLPDFG